MSLLLALLGGGGPTIISADGNAAGTSTVSGISAAIWSEVASSAGTGTATGISSAIAGAVANAAGLGTATAQGENIGTQTLPIDVGLLRWNGERPRRYKRKRPTTEELLADLLVELKEHEQLKQTQQSARKARQRNRRRDRRHEDDEAAALLLLSHF